MKKVIWISGLIALLILSGCSQPNPQNETPSDTNNTAPPAAVVPSKPPLQPIHLSYVFSSPGPQGQPQQKIDVDYYFDESTTCKGRLALNGFMKASSEGQQGGTNYQKVTVYLDNGEAAYSDQLNESSMAFDNATPRAADFDPAFYLQTITATGGKQFLSDEIWNATKPVLFKDISAFGSTGDYSIIFTGNDTVADLDCRKFTISAKTSNMEGQTVVCIHLLADLNFSFLTSGKFLGDNSISWTLSSLSREKPSLAYYPQCLEPVSCPSVTAPTQQDYDACNALGNTIEQQRNSQNCITAFKCITREEQARTSIGQNQRPGCAVKDEFVQEAANCWKQNGNVNYEQGQDGCIQKINCAMPQSGNNP